jgi:hypothetical protein
MICQLSLGYSQQTIESDLTEIYPNPLEVSSAKVPHDLAMELLAGEAERCTRQAAVEIASIAANDLENKLCW